LQICKYLEFRDLTIMITSIVTCQNALRKEQQPTTGSKETDADARAGQETAHERRLPGTKLPHHAAP